jgi:hypothetical protein
MSGKVMLRYLGDGIPSNPEPVSSTGNSCCETLMQVRRCGIRAARTCHPRKDERTRSKEDRKREYPAVCKLHGVSCLYIRAKEPAKLETDLY